MTQTADKLVEINASRHFASWFAGQGVSLSLTTYQASKMFMLGVTQEGELSVTERTLDRCMGDVADKKSLYIASKWQIWRFENALSAGERSDGFDAVYVPEASHVTSDIDCHEMAVDGDGRLVFVNTLFNCLSYLSQDYSFHPAWKPDFISAYAPEDRCHLNGLALRDGKPAYVTAVSRSDVADGWRDRRQDGGIVLFTFKRTKSYVKAYRCLTLRVCMERRYGCRSLGRVISAVLILRARHSSLLLYALAFCAA